MNEKSFLADYDPKAFESPIFTVDSVLFTYHDGMPKVLMVKRSNHPDKGKWGLPGGFIDLQRDSCLEDAVIRKLREKTGVVPPYLEQLLAEGGAKRDKRGWSVTVCYTALMAYQASNTNIESVTDAQWTNVEALSTLKIAFDHAALVIAGRARLRQKALYSIVPAYALPERFTLSELQKLHEVLIGKPLQKKSFRRRIIEADLLRETTEMRQDRGRPSKLYSVKPSSRHYTFVRNLKQ
jgi:8-oxo-dGTP diphosphatase